MVDYLYEDLVARYSDKFVRVRIPQSKVERIKLLAKKIVEVKSKESHHVIDSGNEEKRFFNGLMGEAAIEEYFDMNIIEWEVGNSNDYNHPDIKELGIGIKTVERNKFPVISKVNKCPQIICILSDKIKNVVFICGIATTEVLNRYQSDLLILSKNLYGRGSKTGFYGFCKLKPIKELKNMI